MRGVMCAVATAVALWGVAAEARPPLDLEIATASIPKIVAAEPAPAVQVVVYKTAQEVSVSVAGVEQYRWPVSTGRKARWTPAGDFKPAFLSRNHRSSRYNNAPMPYAVFFNGNIALHGTTDLKRLGQPASHGCVRLHPDNAKTLFELIETADLRDVVIQVVD